MMNTRSVRQEPLCRVLDRPIVSVGEPFEIAYKSRAPKAFGFKRVRQRVLFSPLKPYLQRATDRSAECAVLVEREDGERSALRYEADDTFHGCRFSTTHSIC